MLDQKGQRIKKGDLVHVPCIVVKHAGDPDILHLIVAKADHEGRQPEWYLHKDQATVEGDRALVACVVTNEPRRSNGTNLTVEVCKSDGDGFAQPIALNTSQVTKAS